MTSTCGRLEGFTSAIEALRAIEPSDGRRRIGARLEARVRDELARNRPLQIVAGTETLEMPDGEIVSAPSLADNVGAFRAGTFSFATRTDITQHCIAAFLKAHRLGLDRPSTPAGQASNARPSSENSR